MREGIGKEVTGCALPKPDRYGEGSPRQEGDGEGGGDEQRMYRIKFPEKAGMRPYLVEGYSGRATPPT